MCLVINAGKTGKGKKMRKFKSNNGNYRRVDYKRYDNEPEGTAVALREGESADSLIRRFKKVVESSGILKDLRLKEFHMSPSEKKKDKRRRAAKRLAKAQKLLSNDSYEERW